MGGGSMSPNAHEVYIRTCSEYIYEKLTTLVRFGAFSVARHMAPDTEQKVEQAMWLAVGRIANEKAAELLAKTIGPEHGKN